MTTISYPAEGNGGLSVSQWSKMYSDQDGIINDYDGLSCVMTRNSATNVATIATGMVSVNGYVLEITAAEDLAVSTTAATYYIAAKYDPTLNVADGSGNAPALGPCRLVLSSGAPSIAAGESYTLLYTITRTAGQALAAATVTDYRRWVGPNVICNILPAGEKAFPRVAVRGFGPFPVGTSLFESTTGNLYRFFSPNESLEWVSITDTVEVAFPMAGSGQLSAFDATPMYRKVAGEVMLRGTIKRTNGANLSTTGAEVDLGTLPAGYRPSSFRRFICYGNGIGNLHVIAPVKVATNGVVTMYDPPNTVVWIDLSAIQFRGA